MAVDGVNNLRRFALRKLVKAPDLYTFATALLLHKLLLFVLNCSNMLLRIWGLIITAWFFLISHSITRCICMVDRNEYCKCKYCHKYWLHEQHCQLYYNAAKYAFGRCVCGRGDTIDSYLLCVNTLQIYDKQMIIWFGEYLLWIGQNHSYLKASPGNSSVPNKINWYYKLNFNT